MASTNPAEPKAANIKDANAASSRYTLQRQPNHWVELRPGVRVQFADWQISSGLMDLFNKPTLQQAHALLAACIEDFPVATADQPATPSGTLASLAQWLHSIGYSDSFEWLRRAACALRAPEPNRLVYPFLDHRTAADIGPRAARILGHALAIIDKQSNVEIEAKKPAVAAMLDETVDLLRASFLHDNAMRVLVHAADRGIPIDRSPLQGRVVSWLGQGVKRRMLSFGVTDRTAHAGVVLTTHKDHAALILREAGLPAPRHAKVTTLEEAQKAFASLVPKSAVVVKPASTDKGTGVSVGLRTQESLKAAFEIAAPHGPVLIEEMIEGDDHRLHVLGGKVIYVVRRLPAHVVGDGYSTIEELMHLASKERAMDRVYRKFPLPPISDPGIQMKLAEQSLTNASVPAVGQRVLLRSNSNISTGGVFDDMSDVAHPDNLRMAERAARILHLDNAGVDFICKDISKSWREAGGGICEVNYTPGLFFDRGNKAIVEHLFPEGDDGRIPIALLIGEPSGFRQFLEDFAKAGAGPHARATIVDGVLAIHTPQGQYLSKPAPFNQQVRTLLQDPAVGSALVQCSFSEAMKHIDLDYANALVVMGTEDEIAQFKASPLAGGHRLGAVLYNPTPAKARSLLHRVLGT